MRTEWVIHIWGKEREKLILTPQEKFHIDMIKNQDHSIFDKVLINISMDNFYDKKLFKLLKMLVRLFVEVVEYILWERCGYKFFSVWFLVVFVKR